MDTPRRPYGPLENETDPIEEFKAQPTIRAPPPKPDRTSQPPPPAPTHQATAARHGVRGDGPHRRPALRRRRPLLPHGLPPHLAAAAGAQVGPPRPPLPRRDALPRAVRHRAAPGRAGPFRRASYVFTIRPIKYRTRNRRRAYLHRLVTQGDYFSEEAMREREPYLHHEYLGRFQDPLGRAMVRPGEKFSETLMRRAEEAVIVEKIRGEQMRRGVDPSEWVGGPIERPMMVQEEEEEEEEEKEEEEERG
uniref:CCD97-like C-terminal domain-containing protein n=1 Tax=Aegilops tauschii TaxID=37682 RepID=M8BNC1_AEGTA